ncbi:MAG: DNA-processing protein DprA [Candidatus Shapirobacteria bacterium]|jgi:DNA processing protein
MMRWREWPIKEIKATDVNFPEGLKKIKPGIKALYYRGRWDDRMWQKTLSVVGSRRMTRYGREMVEMLMPGLVANKITVISGFMYGIDTYSHQKCIELGGKTVAVLGCGLDVLYPRENDQLYSDIVSHDGLVISEYECKFTPTLWSFPQRNRIVAGLATLGVVVVEAGIKSGSLITARLAKKQSKRVMAIPGPVTSKLSEGTNWLIKEGTATLITGYEDIEGGLKEQEQYVLFEKEDKETGEFLSCFEAGGITVDELAVKLGINVSEVTIRLTRLLMENKIQEENGLFYRRLPTFKINNVLKSG